ncbi:MAG: hypothetical protein OM95_14055 [Bdellovibrio sp. ArHS]|uniref:hypothetical protein n=1 Tax=Bdellovibrio sp. ArHS TaxID=1569284 RepID=UPI00058303A8|nr:hypothetical protein [Bdellovibrio sp. ArHS]KHD87491.1 MAG: hypothetical protein OM95_14055 [Bdellovibrio sp. ArHS]
MNLQKWRGCALSVLILNFLMVGFTNCSSGGFTTVMESPPSSGGKDPVPEQPVTDDENPPADSGSEPVPPSENAFYVQPSATICDVAKAGLYGLFCAIKPSRIDPSARDIYGTGTLADQRFGFGYHAIGFPPTGTEIQGTYLHFVGSYGRPYNPWTAKFDNDILLEEGMKKGFIVVQLAYDNRFMVNEDVCMTYKNFNNCAGLLRKEKITGQDVFPYADTPLADSIEQRLRKLSAHLISANVFLPIPLTKAGAINYSALNIGGHSQGSGHAYFIALWVQVRRACFLGGPYDIADLVSPVAPIADWFTERAHPATPITNMKAALSIDDSAYSNFITSFQYMGLVKNTHWVEVSGAPYRDREGTEINGHGAIIQDPRFESVRANACFN